MASSDYCVYQFADGKRSANFTLELYCTTSSWTLTVYQASGGLDFPYNPAAAVQLYIGGTQCYNGTVNFNPSHSVFSEMVVASGSISLSKGVSYSCSGYVRLGTATSAGNATIDSYIYIAEDAVYSPSVSISSVADASPVVAGKYYSGKTRLKFTVNGTKGSANISKYEIYKNGNVIGTTSTSSTSGVVITTTNPVTGNGSAESYIVRVTDTAGRYGEASTNVTVLPYSNPTITAAEVVRCDSSGTATDSGTYFKGKMTYSLASGVSATSATLTVNSQTQNVTASNTWTAAKQGNLNSSTAYTYKFSITDSFNSVAEFTGVLYAGGVAGIDLYPSSTGGVGVGTVAEDGKFTCRYPATFASTITLGTVTLTSAQLQQLLNLLS